MAQQTLNNLDDRGDFRGKLNDNFTELYAVANTKADKTDLDLVSVTLVGSPATLTLDMNSQRTRRFLIDTTIDDHFELIISDVSNFRILEFMFDCSTNIQITMPTLLTSPDTLTVMPANSGTSWVDSVLSIDAGIYGLVIENDGTYYRAILSPAYV